MNLNRWKEAVTGVAFCLPWLIGLSLFTLYPVAASLFYSFCDYSILQSPIWIGTENFQQLAQDELFWKSLKNTLIYAALSLPLGTLVSLSIALLLNCKVMGTPFFRTLFFLPSIVPVIASSMLWLWMLHPSHGLLNHFLTPLLAPLGLHPPAWMADPAWIKPAMVLMSVWGVGQSAIIYLAGLQNVPQELYESSEIDGANRWQQFLHVTLPMISPVIYFNVVMGIIGALQVFTQFFVMTGGTYGGADRAGMMYTLYLYNMAFERLRMGYASAMAWVLFVVIAGLTVLATRVAKKHVHYAT